MDIKGFYSEDEAKVSNVYEDYFLLENLLTPPIASFKCFDDNLKPVYASECRTKEELEFIDGVHRGILQYFEMYINYTGVDVVNVEKVCSERMLNLMHKVCIHNDIFADMTWEDGFFQRSVKVKDMI